VLTPDLNHGRLDAYQAISRGSRPAADGPGRTVILEGISVLTLSPAKNGASDSLKIKSGRASFGAAYFCNLRLQPSLLDLKDLNTGVHSTRLAAIGACAWAGTGTR